MHFYRLILLLLATTTLLAGCRQSAEQFFSGRPSEMAMVHNRIIGGPPEAMLDLLRVPSRFPEATEAHVALWQESAIAWWRNPEKHDQMIASFGRLSRDEMQALENWLRVRDRERSADKARTLDAIEATIKPPARSSLSPAVAPERPA
jgi:hypothetical protein